MHLVLKVRKLVRKSECREALCISACTTKVGYSLETKCTRTVSNTEVLLANLSISQ